METALKFALMDKNYTFLARELLNYFEIEDFLTINEEISEYHIRLNYTPVHGFNLITVDDEEEGNIAIPSDLLNEFVEEAVVDNYSEIHDDEISGNFLSDYMNHLEDCYPCAKTYMRIKSDLVNKLPGLLSEYAMEIAEQAEDILNDTKNYISDIHLNTLKAINKTIRIRFDIEIVNFDELIAEDDFDGICEQIPEIVISGLPQLLQKEFRTSTLMNEEPVNHKQIQWDSKVLWILYNYMGVSLDEIDELLEESTILLDDQLTATNKTRIKEIINEMDIFTIK